MIGVIGPADSVRLALEIARAEGIDQVIARSYETVDQAPSLARELDPVCQVLLLTGRTRMRSSVMAEVCERPSSTSPIQARTCTGCWFVSCATAAAACRV